jgi:hypothetical protein
VPATLGGGTLATVDVKRAASGQSSATQRLGGALVGGAGDAIKTVGSVSSAIPGIKDTGTPRETQQTGEWMKNAGSNIQKDVDRKLSNEKGQQPAVRTKLPVYNSYLFDLNNNEYINEAQVLGKKGKKWISITTDASGKKTETEVSPTPQAIQRYNTFLQKPKPEPQRGSTNAQGKFYTGSKYEYQSAETARKHRLLPDEALGVPDKPAQPKQDISPAPPASTKTAPTKPSPPKSAIERSAQGYAVGTTKGGTKYEIRTPTRAEMDASRKAGGGEAGVKAAVAAGQPTTGPAPTQAQMSDAGAAAKAAAAASKVKKESYDAYDLVLEYLLSQGHAETIAEAHYVMMEMDAEMIGDIVESYIR